MNLQGTKLSEASALGFGEFAEIDAGHEEPVTLLDVTLEHRHCLGLHLIVKLIEPSHESVALFRGQDGDLVLPDLVDRFDFDAKVRGLGLATTWRGARGHVFGHRGANTRILCTR